jgi:hypothetical protein
MSIRKMVELSGFDHANRVPDGTPSHVRAPKTPMLYLAARAKAALLVCMVLPSAAAAATLQICRTLDLAGPLGSILTIPAGSLYRDNGRADDPLADFNGERWQLRLETIADAVIPPLQQCVRTLVRITSDSSVKAVSVGDNRRFVYLGTSRIIDRPDEPEELLTTRGRVIDQVP